jgi:DNA-binding response OmpR family regulator
MDYLSKSGYAIILVEDDLALSKLYARILHMYGHDIYVMHSGDEFVKFMRGASLHRFDEHAQDLTYVALVDCNLPGISGDDAIAEARKTQDGDKVHYIGMSSLEENLPRFLAKGADKAVVKSDLGPQTLDQLIRAA